MLKSQFEKLRDGDFYFYLGDPYLPNNIREQIKHTTFSDVIKRNTGLDNIEANVFHTDPCEVEQTITSKNITAEAVPNAGYKIYPNPVQNLLNIDLASLEQTNDIKIFSSDGVLVKTITATPGQNRLQLNTSNLTSGTYILNINSVKGTKSFKFVKL